MHSGGANRSTNSQKERVQVKPFLLVYMSKYGFVYCLMNADMPDLYKIGCTEKSPQMRADELSKATGVPSEFSVVCYIECEQPQRIEQEIHKLLANDRPNARREFFETPLTEIIAAFFYHPQAISWIDRLGYENTHKEAHSLANPYKEVLWQG